MNHQSNNTSDTDMLMSYFKLVYMLWQISSLMLCAVVFSVMILVSVEQYYDHDGSKQRDILAIITYVVIIVISMICFKIAACFKVLTFRRSEMLDHILIDVFCTCFMYAGSMIGIIAVKHV